MERVAGALGTLTRTPLKDNSISGELTLYLSLNKIFYSCTRQP